MISKVGDAPSMVSVESVRRQRGVVWAIGSAAVVLLCAVLVTFAGSYSLGGSIAVLVLIGAIVAASIRPILGVYAIVFLTLIGDSVTAPWLLFSWNFSSRETLLYLSDKLFISPLEVLVAATTLFWLLGDRPRRFVAGPVFWATAVFTCFVGYGFVYGFVRGGDLRISLFEGRAMFLLLAVYALIVNMFDADALRRLTWTALAAILVHALVAMGHYNGLSNLERDGLESLGEHPAAVHWNVILILAIVLLVYPAGSAWFRFVVFAMCVPVGFVYLAAQRRAAIAGLVVAVAVVLLSLLWQRRAKFFVIAPVLAIVLAGYTAAFWNSTSTLGFPAQAIKTIIGAEDALSEEDRGSDMYRQIENFDLNYTIRALAGAGSRFRARVLPSDRACPTSASSSSTDTSRTTIFCGSGSRRDLQASCRCC